MNLTPETDIIEMCRASGIQCYRQKLNEIHFVVESDQLWMPLCHELAAQDYYLVSVIANDERELEDNCYKLYYIFSPPTQDIFLFLEYPLARNIESYPSIFPDFPGVEPYEHEIYDLMGLYPNGQRERVASRSLLHGDYPGKYYALRKDFQTQTGNENSNDEMLLNASQVGREDKVMEGEVLLPVGPIHSGIIEPGRFHFRISGETIEGLDIRLGYTHKGIEYLFQNRYYLDDGWKLAEQVSGDASFAHSMAYCQAVEALGNEEVPYAAQVVRGILLELERIANHIGDSSALAGDVALDMVASEMSVLRETVMRLNEKLSGSRFLKGVNRPGGVILPRPINTKEIQGCVHNVVASYIDLAYLLSELSDFRERLLNTGVLPEVITRKLGITGLAARASGLKVDYRLQHPQGIYRDTCVGDCWQSMETQLPLIITRHPMTGDVFSRFLVRVKEVVLSSQLIDCFIEMLHAASENELIRKINISAVQNYEFGLGYVEAWRGPVVYWIMKDKFNRIFRCKVRDPSTPNWLGLKTVIEPHWVNDIWIETTVADFPVINKSFNLSYSGNDL